MSDEQELRAEQLEKLKKLVENDASYRVRLVAGSGGGGGGGGGAESELHHAETSIQACQLVVNQFAMHLQISLDSLASPVALYAAVGGGAAPRVPAGSASGGGGGGGAAGGGAGQSQQPHACKRAALEILRGGFTANAAPQISNLISVQKPTAGPNPEIVEYLRKVSRQQEEKAKQEQSDNRSFLAKYWYYIVPAVIFIAMLRTPQQEGGE